MSASIHADSASSSREETGILGGAVGLGIVGLLSGSLAFVGISMFATTVGVPPQGGTPSPQLAVVFLALATLVAVTGFGVSLSIPWAMRLCRWIALGCLLTGIGGILYFVLSTLIVGMFPSLLLTPDNLAGMALFVLATLAGLGLRRRQAETESSSGRDVEWIRTTWHPVAVGVILGLGVSWLFGLGISWLWQTAA
jgi:hypothetical protein